MGTEKADISIKPGFVLSCVCVALLVGAVAFGLTGDAERAALWGGITGGVCCATPFVIIMMLLVAVVTS